MFCIKFVELQHFPICLKYQYFPTAFWPNVDLINAVNGRIASRCWRCSPQCWHHSTLHHLLKTNILFVEMKWINLLFIGFFSMIVQRVSTWLHMQQELAHMRTNLCWGGAEPNWIRLVEPHYLRIFATTLQYFCNFILHFCNTFHLHWGSTELLWFKKRYVTKTVPQPTSFDPKHYVTKTGPQLTF